MFQPFIPVLAIGAGTIVTFIVLSVYVLSWLANLAQGNKPNVPKPRNRPRPNNGPSELEKFLQDVIKKSEPESRPAPPKPPRPAGEKKKARQASNPNAAPPQAARPAAAKRPATRLSQTHLQTSTKLGDGVRSHLASHLDPRNVDNQVEKDISAGVQRDIDRNVRKDLGSDLTAAMPRQVVEHPLMQALRNPQGVRQAILMAEILNRPKALR
jgi:hypothetical protein